MDAFSPFVRASPVSLMPSIDDASVAVALGANQPSAAGSPRETLVAVRPLLEKLLRAGPVKSWFAAGHLHDTAPVGGPPSPVTAMP